MSNKVEKWLKRYPSAGMLVKIHFQTFYLFLHGGERSAGKVKKWLKSYPSGGRRLKMDFRTFSFFYMEVGDEQKSEEMATQLSQCW